MVKHSRILRTAISGWFVASAFALGGVLCVSFPAVAAEKAAERNDAAGQGKQRIDELIKQLGSSQFTLRRTAASELRRLGPEAFDQLQAATESADPEIAASARYLLRQVTVQWIRSDDSAIVRKLLRKYGEQDEADRRQYVAALMKLPAREGVAGLGRIARFDQSAEISRLAALAIINSRADETENRTTDAEVLDRELGGSTRVASQWLRQYQIQLRDPAASVTGWQTLVDQESRRLDANDGDTSSGIVVELLQNLADVYRRLGESGPLVQVGERIVGVSSSDSDRVVAAFLQWLLDREAWDALDQFAAKYQARVEQYKLALYVVSLARVRHGRADEGEELAKQASQLDARQPLESFEAGQLLAVQGQFDWAVREYHVAIDDRPLESVQSIAARVYLSNLLQDYEHYSEAADVLTPLVTAIEKDHDILRAYNGVARDLAQAEIDMPEAETLPSRQHFMLACDFEQKGDYTKQREHLLKAIEHNEEDADVLIAMYRVRDADEKWLADVRRRITKLSQQFEQEIEENPTRSVAYNQWAWLIANTEGDYAKAVRYSRRSLELGSENSMASYLDTLGRCYYAVGDYEQAVKNERDAVRRIPHMQVMQRQMALFERALEEKKGKTNHNGTTKEK